MAWNAYLDHLVSYGLDASGGSNLDSGAIIGLNGGGLWTDGSSAAGLAITAEEAVPIARAFAAKDFTSFQSGGITVAGVRYQFLRTDSGEGDSLIVLGKKKEFGGLVLQSTLQAIIIGHCPEGAQQGTTSKAVDKLANYLISTSY